MNEFEKRIAQQVKQRRPSLELGEGLHTIGELTRAVLSIDAPEEAKEFYEGYLEYLKQFPDTKEETERIRVARSNLGWCFGEGMTREKMEMWSEVCRAYHPVFGIPLPSPKEAIEAGIKLARNITQTSCSELLVDTAIHDPEEAYKAITGLMEKMEWESSPPLTVELLRAMKHHNEAQRFEEEDPVVPEVTIYDANGNRCWLEYGYNGYIETLGYRFDSQCNHGDSGCFPIFKAAIERLNGQLIACDGGSTCDYEEWLGTQESGEEGSFEED